MSKPTLFDRVVQQSGLSSVFARASLARALSRVAAKPETLSPQQLQAALPEVEKLLRVFLRQEEVPRRLLALRALLR
jgi:hypothetical protein